MPKSSNPKNVNIDAPDKITLTVIPIGYIPSMILWFVIIIGILVPIVATILITSKGGEFVPGLIITYLIFWGVSIYFFRVLSWNLSGEETIRIMDDKYEIVSRSNLIQFSKETIDLNDSYFTVIPTREKMLRGETKQMGKLSVSNENQTIDLSVELPFDELVKLLPTLNKKLEWESHY